MYNQIYNKSEFKQIRRRLRKQEIPAEKILWSKLRNRQQDFKFRRQYGIGKYIVDFYCPKIKLAIEIDGYTHSTADEKQRDLRKEEFIRNYNIKTIRFTNNDIFNNLEEVVFEIYKRCLKREDKFTPPCPSP